MAEKIGQFQEDFPYKLLFFSLLIAYGLYYAPFGINETDGGFISGLAWQIIGGKTLYGDVLYVRPPLPVWLRTLELVILPDTWGIIGERWIFYLKTGLYSWLGASILLDGKRRWILAIFGFVISVHCYPPMAWHTIDGILFSVLGIWCTVKIRAQWGILVGAVSIFAAILCKQSFYPVPVVFAGMLLLERGRRQAGWGIAVLIACISLFISFLYAKGLLVNYLRLTGGSAEGGQALQHGLLDYFRINPAVALASVPFLVLFAWYAMKKKNPMAAGLAWYGWIVVLVAAYAFEIWHRKEFTAPFPQARMLFWAGIVFGLSGGFELNSLNFNIKNLSENRRFFALVAITWCASVSWGYNLPILFSTPWVFAAMEISRRFQGVLPKRLPLLRLASLLMLLLVFRVGYEFVYRDGRRRDMNTAMGTIFPRLTGIYSRPETASLYLDLKNLASRYPNFKTLPSFPLANYLTRTRPPLPLDWVVRREAGSDTTLLQSALHESNLVFLIEKRYSDKIETDPELSVTRQLLHSGQIIDETPHFWVARSK